MATPLGSRHRSPNNVVPVKWKHREKFTCRPCINNSNHAVAAKLPNEDVLIFLPFLRFTDCCAILVTFPKHEAM